MKTIEDQHTIIAERDKTIVKQAKELGKYTNTQQDQQPPSSQGEQDDCILFDTDLSLNKENEPFPILDDDSIRAHTPIGIDMQSKDDLDDDSKHDLEPNASHNKPHTSIVTTIKTSNSQTTSSADPSVLKNTSSQKSEKTTASSVHSHQHIRQNSSTQVPSSHHKIVKVKREHNHGSQNVVQTKLTDRTNAQSILEVKKRKIPSSLSLSIKPKKMTRPTNDENIGYAYSESCKSKHERSKMNGNICTCCTGYFHDEKPLREFGTNKEVTPEERIQMHSRHRTKYEPPKTPPGFWEVDFPSSFDEQFGDD
jgi:hypothetical protein